MLIVNRALGLTPISKVDGSDAFVIVVVTVTSTIIASKLSVGGLKSRRGEKCKKIKRTLLAELPQEDRGGPREGKTSSSSFSRTSD